MVNKVFNSIYWVTNTLMIFALITVCFMYKFNSWEFLLGSLVTLGVIYPMLNLFLTLAKVSMKLEYHNYKYHEAYLITLLIASTTIFYLVTKLEVNIGFDVWNYIFYSTFILIHVIYIYLDYKNKEKGSTNGPKFIANK